MKKFYEEPNLELLYFSSEDILDGSPIVPPDEEEPAKPTPGDNETPIG